GGANTIEFHIGENPALDPGPGYDPATGICTIMPQSDLEVTDPVLINGYTQAGASRNTRQIGDDAKLKIQLDGSGVDEMLVIRANDSTVSGLVINRVGTGILLLGNGDVAQGNFIGTDVTGSQVVPDLVHSHAWGMRVLGVNDLVGGTTPDARNIISGMG